MHIIPSGNTVLLILPLVVVRSWTDIRAELGVHLLCWVETYPMAMHGPDAVYNNAGMLQDPIMHWKCKLAWWKGPPHFPLSCTCWAPFRCCGSRPSATTVVETHVLSSDAQTLLLLAGPAGGRLDVPDLIRCDWMRWLQDFGAKGCNPHTLIGALVGGPDLNDKYEDKRGNYVQNEVAVDYNAAITGVFLIGNPPRAACTRLGLQHYDENLPSM
jgi:hypothetical protein